MSGLVGVWCCLHRFLVEPVPNCSIIENEVLKFPTTVAELSISPFNSVNCYFIYLGALLLGSYMFRIVVSS